MRVLSAGILLSALFLAVGCSAPNAYKQRADYQSYGYAGKIGESLANSNLGYTVFAGDKTITESMLKNHCLRRAAELSRDKGYDYFQIIKTDYYTGKAKESKSRYAGRGEDAIGKYERYWVWDEKVDSQCLRLDFRALRGPLPVFDVKKHPPERYSVDQVLNFGYGLVDDGKSPPQSAPVKCAVCEQINQQPATPEHCDACGKYLFDSLICPFCAKETRPVRQGKNKCLHCGLQFRFSSCTACGMEHILRDFRPFKCSFCRELSEPGVESGKDNFLCPHCHKRMNWPAELNGQYACVNCQKIITIQTCPECSEPHALDVAKPYTCWLCGTWVKLNSPKEEIPACPHCQKIQSWLAGPAAVGMCLPTGKKVYLAHCLRCEKWLALDTPGDFFCSRCGTWTGIYWCDNCREFQRGDPNDRPDKCPRCSKNLGQQEKSAPE